MDQYYLDNMLLGMPNFTHLHRFAVNGKISGNLACISEMKNTAVILYGPRGCGFHYRYTARTRNHPYYGLECTDMRDADVVFGGEKKLVELIKKIDAEQQPEMIFVVPSVVADVINDDMVGIVESLQPQVKALLLPVTSQVFSHMDKSNSRRMLREKAKQQANAKSNSSVVYKGCGYVEVMDTIVDRVMEPQEVDPRAVNIEGFVWGYNGQQKLKSMVELLGKMGIRVNSFLPAADRENLRLAPKAALNIVRRKKWALAMESRFGTPFLHIANMQEWHGFKGITEFYEAVGQSLGMTEEVARVLEQERAKVEGRYQELRAYFGGFKFALMAHGLGYLTDQIRCYQRDYGFPISKLCVVIDKNYKADTGMDEAMVERFLQKAKEELAASCNGQPGEIILCPGEEELKATIDSCDYLISGGNPYYATTKTPILYNLFDRAVWSYADFVAIMEEVKLSLEEAKPLSKSLLLKKLAYDQVFFPTRAEDEDSLASREMFSKLWRQRKR